MPARVVRGRVAATLLVLAGCGPLPAPDDPSYLPLSVGPGPRYRPPPGPTAAGRPIGRFACAAASGPRLGLHLELFAHRRVIIVPAGIGVGAPRRDGPAYVRRGRCFYPLVTREPTGVVEIATGAGPLRLGDLFALWGQPLSRTRLAGFGGAGVRAYVDGRALAGDPAAVRLRPDLEIVLEISGHVPPHRSYRFAPGL